MASAEHRYGDCYIGVQARLVGDQPIAVQGVAAVASTSGRQHIAVTVGRILIYLEDRVALAALAAATERALGYADEVFGPIDDAITDAQQRQHNEIARTGRLPRR